MPVESAVPVKERYKPADSTPTKVVEKEDIAPSASLSELRNKFNAGTAPPPPEAQISGIPKAKDTPPTRKKSAAKLPTGEVDELTQLRGRVKELEDMLSKRDAEISQLKATIEDLQR